MKYNLTDKTLTISIEGEINSNNAEQIETEIDEIISKNICEKLILDFENLTYISSAGLRVVLKLKKRFPNFTIDQVNLEVYDIFSMTGFVDIMDVKKALNKVDVTGCEIIGEGYFSIVYRIDKDTIIKVFKEDTDIKNVERELNLAKQAFVLGIPTAISFDVVKVGDKLGVRFEMLNSVSLRDMIRDNPDKFDQLVKKYAELLITINTTRSQDTHLPNTKEHWLRKVEFIKEYLDEDQYQKCKSLIGSVPEKDTFVHGDCHVKNILTQGDELLLIDMDTLSKGHHIFELAALYAPYIAFEEDDPGNSERFMGLSFETTQKIFYDTLKYYFGKESQEYIEKIKIVAYIHMVWWNRTFQPENYVRLEGCKKRLLSLIDKYDNLDIEN